PYPTLFRSSRVGRRRRLAFTGRPQAYGAAPLVVHRTNVVLAELQAQRPLRPSGAVALGLLLDTAIDDRERNAFGRPAAHQLEGRTDDPDDVPFVDASQVLFDAPAVLPEIEPVVRLLLRPAMHPTV